MINLILSVRSVIRSRIYLVLNVFGLGIAFAIAFFILSYVIRETSFNKSIDNYERIARVLTVKKGFGWTEPSASYPMHLAIKSSIPGVEAASPLRRFRNFSYNKGEDQLRIRYAFACTNDFFRIFTPDIIYGNSEDFFKDPNSIVISRSLAEKLFGEIPDIGSSIEIQSGANKLQLTIGGIFEDLPQTTSLQPELLASVELMKYEFAEGTFYYDFWDSWDKDIFDEFVLLNTNSDIDRVSAAISNLNDRLPEGFDYDFKLQRMSKIHLHSVDLVNDGRKGDIKFVLLFAAVGLLILLIAISNFIIMSIGASSRRIPEIATRKIFGARSATIRSFIFVEALLVCLISVPLALVIKELTAEGVEALFRIKLELDGSGTLLLVLFTIALVLITGAMSGAYLAGKLGRISALEVLGTKGSGKGGSGLYKILITSQIIIFVTLLSSAFIVLKQLNYSKNADQGYNSDNLINAEFPSRLVPDFNALKYELLKNPQIESVTFGGLLPPTNSAGFTIIKAGDGGEDLRVEGVTVDFDFIKTMGITLLAGRDFNPDIPGDSTATLINEKLAQKLGVDWNSLHTIKRPGNVIGIVKDFQIHSAREAIGPITVRISQPRYISSLILRYRPGFRDSVIETLEDIFNAYEPAYLGVASYEDALAGLYGKEARFGYIVTVFGLIALIVAMLGVYGLSLFLTNERKYQTAISRVFGADTKKIVLSNIWRYLVFIILGNVISIPLTIIFMSKWLEQFAYRSPIGPGVFILAFLLSAIVFLSTTMINTFRLANINPAENLRQA